MQFVTKYFNAEKNWDHYNNGSFKFGTLKEYRSTEVEATRMSDRFEGIALDAYGSGSGRIERIITPEGSVITGFEYSGVNVGLLHGREFNCHVFCATSGIYQPSHHEIIRFGSKDGAGYKGNYDLDAYAVIDVSHFLLAFQEWVFRSLKPSPTQKGAFSHREVSYGPREKKMPVSSNIVLSDRIDGDQLMESIFTKPNYFQAEMEYRLAVLLNFPRLLSEFAEPLYPQSGNLRKSVIAMGRSP